MSYYPIFIDLQGKKVIVVGGGTVAQRKIETLLEYGAVVHVIARQLTPTLNEYVEEGKMKLLGREFRESYLSGAFVVIAEKGLLVNAVDQPSDCNFIVPSILRRGDLLIAVSTSGKSPALAKKVRETLEKKFGSEYELLLILMGHLRKEILSRGLSQDENMRIFHDLVDSRLLRAIGEKDWDEVASILNGIIETGLSSDDILDLLRIGY
ncbi:MAG: bifunctional precorrin-2 dehydrogenase/sirohydrochlorin ferrochelatase [Deltaproteobacteria bacterium]|nr:bifunctional precorrin-2 dehydrogenase/sirohydrochlorin ferrochelatase [Deltaproteobacteria bacterium]